jgi:hypothetical protein
LESLITILLAWIGEHSTYDTTQMPVPAVIELSPEALTREAYADAPEHIPANGIDENLFAFYSWDKNDSGTIFIRPAEDTKGPRFGDSPLDNPVFKERLLHELVHHVQYLDGAYERFPCKNSAEAEAYKLGAVFLQQENVPDPLPNRSMLIHYFGLC